MKFAGTIKVERLLIVEIEADSEREAIDILAEAYAKNDVDDYVTHEMGDDLDIYLREKED